MCKKEGMVGAQRAIREGGQWSTSYKDIRRRFGRRRAKLSVSSRES